MASRFIPLGKFDVIGYDTEGTGLQYPVDHAFGFSIATPDGWSAYFDIREEPQAIEWINDEMANYRGRVAAHNASFDFKMSHVSGIRLPLRQMDCTVVRACLIDEHLLSYDLDSVSKKYLRKEKHKEIWPVLAEMFGGAPTKNCQVLNLQRAPSRVVAEYAIPDAELALELWQWQEREIDRQGLQKIWLFEREKTPILTKTEMRGIRVDVGYAEEAADKLTPIIDEKQGELEKLAGWEINVNSPPQIKKLFAPEKKDGAWFANDGTMIGTTDGGGPSLKAEFLREMKHPAAPLILEIRSLIKNRDTFLRGHVIGHAHNGRVYPTINQTKGEDGGTGTGRLSIQEPAMQQIPSRNKKVAAIIKPCFLPEEGQVWVDADMASFEVRVFAHLVNNPTIVAAYEANPDLDFHKFVAELTGLPRNATYSGEANAKQLNLSMIFNSGNGAIADKMGMEWEWNTFETRTGEKITYKKAGPEAEAVIAKYHQRVPGVKQLADGCKAKAEQRGYIFTAYGRHLRFPRKYKTYKASGLLIQATSADLNKENWSIIDRELEGVGNLILNTHDSYSMSLPEGSWREHFDRVKNEIEKPRLRVPLILELSGAGVNWWDAIRKDK